MVLLKKYRIEEVLPYIVLSLLYTVLVIPLALRTETGVSGTIDEVIYHYRTVLTFVEQFPDLDLRNYYAATPPLYYLLLMFAAFVVGPNLVPLRFVSALISLICLLFVYRYLSKRGGFVKGLLFTIVFLLSPYFIRSAIMLFSDNTAFLFALLSIMIMDSKVAYRPKFMFANLFVLFAVLTRQFYIWLSGVTFFLSIWNPERPRIRIILVSVLSTIIPIISLVYFVSIWGGLNPVPIQGIHQPESWFNGHMVGYVVSLMGLYGGCLASWYYKAYRPYHHWQHILYLACLLIAGIVFLLIYPLSNEYYVVKSGGESYATRGGILFAAASYFPALFSNSIVYWLLFPLGLVLLYITVLHLASRREFVLLYCIPLWILVHMASNRIYQRYYELFVLFVIGYSLVVIRGNVKWYDWCGAFALVTMLAAMTVFIYTLPIVFSLCPSFPSCFPD